MNDVFEEFIFKNCDTVKKVKILNQVKFIARKFNDNFVKTECKLPNCHVMTIPPTMAFCLCG